MTGQRRIKLQVRVSASPVAISKQNKSKSPKKAARSAAQTFSSTILTSPSAPQLRRPANRYKNNSDNRADSDYMRDDCLASDSDEDEDAFESVPVRRTRRKVVPDDELGPPITEDQYLAHLPELHRDFIHQFVEEAKKEVERIRNSKNMKKPIFTEANLREMAAHWTTTLDAMREIPSISSEAINRWGDKLLPLIKRYYNFYESTMNENDNRDIDMNHQNVITITSDSDVEDSEIEYLDEDDEAAFQEAESRYFQQPTTSSEGGRSLPWKPASSRSSSAPKKSGRGGFPFRGRSRGQRKPSARRSNGSASGRNTSGVSKRKSSGPSSYKRGGAASKASSSNTKSSNLMKRFGNQGGRADGGMGGGIGMMPT